MNKTAIWKKGREEQTKHLREISKLGTEKIKQNPQLSVAGGKARISKITALQQSEFGKKSRMYENKAIEHIMQDFDKMFLPYEVCDRIAVKNGEIYFIEVKKKNQRLRPKQDEFKNIAGSKYKVIFA